MRSSAAAPLPARAWALGGAAVALWAAAAVALVLDLRAGREPWVALSFVAVVGAALGWVLADAPLRYERDGDTLIVVTRARRVVLPCRGLRAAPGVGKDRFAINGGFGWVGWFVRDGEVVRAWVSDPARAVRVDTGGQPALISPADLGAVECP